MQVSLKTLTRSLRGVSIAFLASMAIIGSFMIPIQPAMAMAMANQPLLSSTTFAAMSNKMNASAKDAEGKLESVYGDLTSTT